MSDFAGYTPVYVRSSGNDSTGDGSAGSPYLTVKKGFEKSFAGVGGSMSSPDTPHIIIVSVPPSDNTTGSSAQTTVVEIADSTGTTLTFTLTITSTTGSCTGSYTTTITDLSATAGADAIVSYLSMQGFSGCSYSISSSGSQLTIVGRTPSTDDIEWNNSTQQPYTNVSATNETFSLSGDAISSTVSNISSVIGQDASYVGLYIKYYDASQSISLNNDIYQDFTAYTNGSDSTTTASSLASSVNSSISSYVSASTSGNILTITSIGSGSRLASEYSKPSSGAWLQEGNVYSLSLIGGNICGAVSSSSNTAGANASLAVQGSGNYVIDVGSGSFAGFSLNDNFLTNPVWPSRIAIIGAGSTNTSIGNINGNAINAINDINDNCLFIAGIESCPISINSNNTITFGNISANGISLLDNYCGTPGYSPSAGNGQSISLSGVICGNITSNGGSITTSWDYRPQGDGGDIILIDTVCSGINSNGSNGGDVTLTDCKLYGNISASGLFTYDTAAQSSNTFPAMSGGLNGNVTLEGSTNIPDTMIGNLITSANLNRGRGVNGSNILGIV